MTEKNGVEKIQEYWFGELDENGLPESKKQEMWWKKDENTDRYIKDNFENLLLKAKSGELDGWLDDCESMVAYIVLLDQFSRNMYRGTPGAFSQDSLAIAATLEGIRRGFDKNLKGVQKIFFYITFMHSEDIGMQQKSLEYFGMLEKEYSGQKGLAEMMSLNNKYARLHYDIVKRFGRFPHRNKILGRESTREETLFLKEPGSSF